MSTHRIRRVVVASALVAAPLVAALATAQTAGADPLQAKNNLVITVVCPDGVTYTAVTNGNGHWTPAHDLNSTSTLVPLIFGDQTLTITDQNGNVLQQQTTPARVKGNASNHDRGTQAACSFSGGSTDPGTGYTVTLVGTVLGVVTPAS